MSRGVEGRPFRSTIVFALRTPRGDRSADAGEGEVVVAGAVDAELGGELADGGAGLIHRDQIVDVGGGEASLGRV
jgi:hypothetical protein